MISVRSAPVVASLEEMLRELIRFFDLIIRFDKWHKIIHDENYDYLDLSSLKLDDELLNKLFDLGKIKFILSKKQKAAH